MNCNCINRTPTITLQSLRHQMAAILKVSILIKYFAPRLYSAQYRAVTGRDYETIIQSIYPNTESVSVVGGEELDPPQFGTVSLQLNQRMVNLFLTLISNKFFQN
jgi:hypothetical protein